MDEKETILFLLENKSKWQAEVPCFVTNSNKLINIIKLLKNSLKGEIAYSYKTNSDPNIARVVLDQGCSFLLSSIEEIEILTKLPGFTAEKLIFQSPSLTLDQVIKIKGLGIKRLIVDSIDQLELILNNIIPDIGCPELLIRINTGVKVERPELPYGMDTYLGFPLNEAMTVLKKLATLQVEGLIRLGVHNHLISQNTYLDVWEKNIKCIADFVASIKQENIKLDFVNFGGGYPVQYSNEVPNISEIGSIISNYQSKISAYYPDIKFIFEPGRKLIAESVTLIGNVAHIKTFMNNKIAILNCSLYNCSLDTLIIKLYLPVCKIDDSDRSKKYDYYVIRGSTPDSRDIFAKNALLPELRSGDFLAFLNAGAYCFGCDFISLPKINNIII